MNGIKSKRPILFDFLMSILLLLSLFNPDLGQAEPADLSDDIEPVSAQLKQIDESSPLISMDFQDANLKDVLKVFSQQAGLNFIASENIKDRKVTLYLDKVSVKDALDTIMRANNLAYQQQKNSKIFIVKEWGRPGIETMTKIFPLQYARVKGSELTEAGEKQEASKKVGIKEIIEGIVTEHGKVIEDARTNSLIVTDLPTQFPKIERTIRELDVRLPQVMIEAEIIETSLDTIDKLGIEWGSSNEGELAEAFGASRISTYPFTKPQEMAKIGPTGDIEGLYTGYISANNLGGVLAMLANDTDTRILARPRILTLNNTTAEIKIIADTAIAAEQTQVSSTQNLGTAVTSAERTETGVTLKVTPQINVLGEITMAIEPSVINAKLSTFFPDLFVDPQTRSAKTTVTVKTGQTVIIGGLINTEDSKSLRKVPGFGDIPLFGNLFRKKEDQTTDKELVIFITPHLVDLKGQTAAQALEEQAPWEYETLGLRERAMEKMLSDFE